MHISKISTKKTSGTAIGTRSPEGSEIMHHIYAKLRLCMHNRSRKRCFRTLAREKTKNKRIFEYLINYSNTTRYSNIQIIVRILSGIPSPNYFKHAEL